MNISFMRNRFIQMVAAAAAIIAICPPAAVAGDASTFDVAGIKLGMTPAEVQAKIAQHFGIATNKVHTYSQQQFVLGGKSGVIAVSYEANGETLQVTFSTVSPNPADAPLASSIQYKLPFSKENSDRLKAAAIQKYGTPSINSFPLQWCVVTTNPGVCDTSRATLSVGNTDLSLSDQQYVLKYMQLS
ncbi:hypothetical protein, partial [Paraburkholderia guartelaensis]|uniref:hypothetical protein n=1 Tax=Paraburkholderia guartelaensis TaxID=2546446 RepID=UPI002AB757DD